MPKGMEHLYKKGTKVVDPKKVKNASPATKKKLKSMKKK